MDPVPHIPFPQGSYPPRHGNRVHPLIDGLPAFRRICAAVEAARHSVWLTVAFIRTGFALPDGRGSLFDLLDRATARGLDVRVIFWRPNPEATYVDAGSTFAGTPEDRAMLRARGSRMRIRWDRAHGAFCHHQKSWIIDAGQAGEIAFVGGINLNSRAMTERGHAGGGGIHDAYVEIAGPSTTDVHHHFVQRWNEASERWLEHGTWGHDGNDELAFPDRVPQRQGVSLVQIQRNVHAGLYRVGHPSPGAASYPIVEGEGAIRAQYLAAIDAARRSIYIENQALTVVPIVSGLERALQRGIEVVLVVPAEPEAWVREARGQPEYAPLFASFDGLARHERFTLSGISGVEPSGGRKPVYIHAKLMLVDDSWATIGSCNLHRNSLFGHTEMNASFWCPATVRALRCDLLDEHLDASTSQIDDRAALQLFRQTAIDNAGKRAAGRADWQGLAFALDPRIYGA